MPSSSGLLHSLSPSIINSPVKPKKYNHYSIGRKLQHNSLKCKASSVIDYDLYDLLGIDNSSDQSQIKNAYRSLQKRCHPDIAGPAGHDMAIILNEAYAVLSNPNLRYVYDKVCMIISLYYTHFFGNELGVFLTKLGQPKPGAVPVLDPFDPPI